MVDHPYLEALRQIRAGSALFASLGLPPNFLDSLTPEHIQCLKDGASTGDPRLDTAFRDIRRVIAPENAGNIASADRQRQFLMRVFFSSGSREDSKRRSRLGGCGRSHLVARNEEGEVSLVPYACCLRVCTECARRISQDRYLNVLKHFSEHPRKLSLRWMTLTIRNCAQGDLVSTIDALLLAFRSFRRGAKVWSDTVEGYIWNLEVTWNNRSRTWHPHVHVVYDGTFLPWSKLKMSWQGYAKRRGLTGDGKMGSCYILRPEFEPTDYERDLGIEPSKTTCKVSLTRQTASPRELAHCLAEVTKYNMKPFETETTPAKAILELTHALHNRRLHGSCGTLTIPPAPKADSKWEILGGLQKVMDDDLVDQRTKNAIIKQAFSHPERSLRLIDTYRSIFYAALSAVH